MAQITTDTHGFIIEGLRKAAARTVTCNRKWEYYDIYWSTFTHTVHIATDKDEVDPDWILVLSDQRVALSQQHIADIIASEIWWMIKRSEQPLYNTIYDYK